VQSQLGIETVERLEENRIGVGWSNEHHALRAGEGRERRNGQGEHRGNEPTCWHREQA